LVPSRYALKIGEIDVMVVSDGGAIAARGDVGPTTPEPAVRAAWLKDNFLPPGRVRLGAERGRGAQAAAGPYSLTPG